jgi:hypothetical protein
MTTTSGVDHNGWKSSAIFIATRCGEGWSKVPTNGAGAVYAFGEPGVVQVNDWSVHKLKVRERVTFEAFKLRRAGS